MIAGGRLVAGTREDAVICVKRASEGCRVSSFKVAGLGHWRAICAGAGYFSMLARSEKRFSTESSSGKQRHGKQGGDAACHEEKMSRSAGALHERDQMRGLGLLLVISYRSYVPFNMYVLLSQSSIIKFHARVMSCPTNERNAATYAWPFCCYCDATARGTRSRKHALPSNIV